MNEAVHFTTVFGREFYWDDMLEVNHQPQKKKIIQVSEIILLSTAIQDSYVIQYDSPAWFLLKFPQVSPECPGTHQRSSFLLQLQ